ncbi:hypothetical protein [Mycobacterium deserti]|uniref:Uncharacterized protein n=1 Tax=Mycobacterium deserti TaxID=2978347 RepID=A0ABT2M593_9MYCO|nr:hypothetical protein [Mycobacterium deserti]MCT7657116.1 hypothetical protein [Mycobacterium deserti]
MTSGGLDPVEQLPVSDWTDQDLLTKDEARDRLIGEIDRTREQLTQLEANDADEAEISLVARRLNAMESIRDEYGAYLGGK